jgi:hypothetical protein
MQKTYRYLARNKVTILANTAGYITEYRSVYQKNLNVYKGIDNLLYFEVKNHDQKPVSLATYTPKFRAYDETDSLIISKDGTSLDDVTSVSTSSAQSAVSKTLTFASTTGLAVGQVVTGLNIIKGSLVTAVSSTTVTINKTTSAVVPNGTSVTFQTLTKKGAFNVNLTEGDLLNVSEQYIKYVIFLEDASGNKTISYADDHFGYGGTILVDSKAMPGPKTSAVIDTFVAEGDFWVAGSQASTSITADPALNGNEALHTLAVYTSAYIGTVDIQATLDNQISGANNWTTLSTLVFDGTETTPKPANVSGVFNYFRFRASADPETKITKILVRN